MTIIYASPKIFSAGVAAIKIRQGFSRCDVSSFAVGVLDSVFPSYSFEIVDGGLFVGKLFHQFVCRKDFRNWFFRFSGHICPTTLPGICRGECRKIPRDVAQKKRSLPPADIGKL